MSMKRSKLLPATVLLAIISLGFAAPGLAGHRNPVDEVSNPNGLNFTDKGVNRANLSAAFVRDGVVIEPNRFREIASGIPQTQVQTVLGQPLQISRGKRGTEWNYNFKFLLVPSQNYIVCQYKVVFDDQQTVREQVWRRRQCERLAQVAEPQLPAN